MNPLDKLKSLYDNAFDGPPRETTAPGERLRETASRLEAAFAAGPPEGLEEIGQIIDREIHHLQGFLYSDAKPSQLPTAELQKLWMDGLKAHGQGWMALFLVYEDRNPGRFSQARQYADEGDAKILQAAREVKKLQQEHPPVG
ncbi:MAG: hypothetical protein ACYCW6_27395 [Candidatus Xenobia bacterium]